MKITDFALIFIGITLPIIIIVYVNVSYTIKAQEQEMYYKKLINAAVEDATSQMKEVESNDSEIDYGYSGEYNNKISVNPEVAKDVFFSSLYNNFGISGNDGAEQYLQTFVPALAIIDYNGVYISSQEAYTNPSGEQEIKHVVKPKRYYTYTYSIKNGVIEEGIVSGSSEYHTVEFTMDDYITHRSSSNTVTSFYMADSNNNSVLLDGTYSTGITVADVVTHLAEKRKELIINVITEEITYATNAANSYAKNIGVSYEFVFPSITQDEMENAIENIGMFAFVQGLNSGNKYLNAKAYAITKLEESTKFYFSIFNTSSLYKLNLYHKDNSCPEYKKAYHNGDAFGNAIYPAYVLTKQQAASAKITFNHEAREGFYPCPVCEP